MAYDGYLIRFGSAANLFPERYLAQDPVITPSMRTDAEAYRDANNDLHRITINNHKTKIELFFLPGLTLAQKQEISRAMKLGLIDSTERKYHIRYWNDDVNDGEGDYREGDFYLADPKYTYRKLVDKTIKTIVYEEFSYTFVQY